MSKTLIRDLAADSFFRLGITEPARKGADSLYIATFHRVLPREYRDSYLLPGLAVTPEELEWLCELFMKNFQVQRLDTAWRELSEGRISDKPRLAVTFDDGQLDNYLYAVPVLDRMGVAATFFIPIEAVEESRPLWHDRMARAIKALSGKEGGAPLLRELGLSFPLPGEFVKAGVGNAKEWDHRKRNEWMERASAVCEAVDPDWDGMMSWEQVRSLSNRGHEIGCHSYHHHILDQCDGPELDKEIVEAKKILEEITGKPVVSYCYPNGNCNQPVLDVIRRAGYSQAVTTKWGINQAGCDPMTLRRLDMTSEGCRDRNGRLSQSRVLMRIAGFKRR